MPFQSEEITVLVELTRSEIEPGAMLTFRAARLIVSDEPAAVVMLDEGTLRPRSGAATMLVYNPKPAVPDALRGTVSEREWIKGGGDMEGVQRVGALAGGILVAMATAEQPTGARRRRLSRFGARGRFRRVRPRADQATGGRRPRERRAAVRVAEALAETVYAPVSIKPKSRAPFFTSM